MDYQKVINILVSENEVLNLQLQDCQNKILKKDEEINMLGAMMDSAAFLQSKIDCNAIEMEQLHYTNIDTVQKLMGIEILKEELEVDLLNEMKARQKEQQALKEMVSIKTNMDLVTEELNETATFYKKIQQLKAALAEANSKIGMAETENETLKKEIELLKTSVKSLHFKPAQL